MSWTIREFTPDDYDALIEVHNQVFADYPAAAEDFRRMDRLKEDKIERKRWLAEEDGRPIGLSFFTHNGWAFHPRKFTMESWVIPSARGRGIGSALFDAAMGAVSEFDPIVVRGGVREDWESSLRFAHARGFVDVQREQESRLDIVAFDPAAFAGEIERVEGEGIRLNAWSELSNLPDAERRYYDLSNIVEKDVPFPDPQTESPFEIWRKRMFESPRFLPECNVIALDGDRWVGMSNMWKEDKEGRVETGLTGVLREYRKRGIASAVKVRCIAEAKRLGFTETITWNEENNTGMLGINIRFGFEMRPGWIELEKVFDAEALAESRKEKKESAKG
jgi:mycothiol synthase